MPYKDPIKQKAAQRASYERRAEKIKMKNYRRRKELGQYNRLRRAELCEYVNLRKDAPCTDCKQKFHPAAMDFDHVRGDKFASVSQLVAYGYGIASIDSEIAKCDLVCSNCHRIRTWTRKIDL
jgi:hypothetical protein